jgi:hypothetical protein
MRFRAKIAKDNLIFFFSILNGLEKIGQSAIIYLDEKCVRISIVTQNIENPKVYLELHQEKLFYDYKIESQSSNAILFELDINLLMFALTSGKNADSSVLKLVKRGSSPFLNFESRVLNVFSY